MLRLLSIDGSGGSHTVMGHDDDDDDEYKIYKNSAAIHQETIIYSHMSGTRHHITIEETRDDCVGSTSFVLTWRTGGICGRVIRVLPLQRLPLRSPCIVWFKDRAHLCLQRSERHGLEFHGEGDGSRYHAVDLPIDARRKVFPMRSNGLVIHCPRDQLVYTLLDPHAQTRPVKVKQGGTMLPRVDELLHVECGVVPWIVAFDAQRAVHFVASYNDHTGELEMVEELRRVETVPATCASQVVVCHDLMHDAVVVGLLCNGSAVLYRCHTRRNGSGEVFAVNGVHSIATSKRWIMLLKDTRDTIALHAGMYHVCDVSLATAVPTMSPVKMEVMNHDSGDEIFGGITLKLWMQGDNVIDSKIELMDRDDELIGLVVDAIDAVCATDHNGCLLLRQILSDTIRRKRVQHNDNETFNTWHYLVLSILDVVKRCEEQRASVLVISLHLLYQSMLLSSTSFIHEKRILNTLLIPLTRQLEWTYYLEHYERLNTTTYNFETLKIWTKGTKAEMWQGANEILYGATDIITNPPDIFSWIHQSLLKEGNDTLFPIVNTKSREPGLSLFNHLRLVCRLIHLFTCRDTTLMSEPYMPDDTMSLYEHDLQPHERVVLALIQEMSFHDQHHHQMQQRVEWLIDALPVGLSTILRDCIAQCRIGTLLADRIIEILGEQNQHLIILFYQLIGRQDLMRHNQVPRAVGHAPTKTLSPGSAIVWFSNNQFIETHEALFHETVIRPTLQQKQQMSQPQLPSMPIQVHHQQQSQQKGKEKELRTSRIPLELRRQHRQLLSTKIFHSDKRVDEVWSLLQTSRPQKLRRKLSELIELNESQSVENIEDSNSIEHQQLLQHISIQVLALPIGRGMFTLSTRGMNMPMNTVSNTTEMDKLSIPPLVLAARVEKSRQKYSIIDASKVFQPYDPSSISEQHIQTMSWSEFHNSVAEALSLAPSETVTGASDRIKVTREWILYHYRHGSTPSEHIPTYVDAGLLLGLGLQGHLKQLSRTDVFSLLKMMHDPTSMAILLGMSCSLVGSEDAQFTRTLSLHIPSLVVGSDMEINSEVQNAAMVGMGLLYCESRNRFMTEVLLNELAIPQDDHSINSFNSSGAGNARGGTTAGTSSNTCTPAIHFMFYNNINMTGINITNFSTNRDRDAYSLSAGFGIGLINLGRGGHVSNKWIDERLIRYMEGGKRPLSDPLVVRRQLQTSVGHDDNATFDRHNHFYRFLGGSTGLNTVSATEQDSSQTGIGNRSSRTNEPNELVNVEVTGPGACIALSLLYLKTNNERISMRLQVPQTRYQIDAVSPIMLTLRTVGQALVMWDKIVPTTCWIEAHIPRFAQVYLDKTPCLIKDEQELEIHAEIYYQIVIGCCLAIGLRYAGSHSKMAYALCETVFRQLDAGIFADLQGARWNRLAKGRTLLSKYALHSCTMTVLFAMCCIMSGSGHLPLMRIIRRWQLQQQNMFHQHRQQCLQHAHGVNVEQSGIGVFNNTYSLQIGLSMCMGLLFLGGGTTTLATNNLSTACLLMALYPRLPQHPLDNMYHHQILRHLYVLACTDRDRFVSRNCMKPQIEIVGGKLLQTVDIESREMRHTSVRITLTHRDGDEVIHEVLHKSSPCLLPSDVSMISRIEIGFESHEEMSTSDDIDYRSSYPYYPQIFEDMDSLTRMICSNGDDSRIVIEVPLKRKPREHDMMRHNILFQQQQRQQQRQSKHCLASTKFLREEGFSSLKDLQLQTYNMESSPWDIKLITAAHVRFLKPITPTERAERTSALTIQPQQAQVMQREAERILLSDMNQVISVLRRYYFPSSESTTDMKGRMQDGRETRRCRSLLTYFELPTRSQLQSVLPMLTTVAKSSSTITATPVAILSLLFPRVRSMKALECLAAAIHGQ